MSTKLVSWRPSHSGNAVPNSSAPSPKEADSGVSIMSIACKTITATALSIISPALITYAKTVNLMASCGYYSARRLKDRAIEALSGPQEEPKDPKENTVEKPKESAVEKPKEPKENTVEKPKEPKESVIGNAISGIANGAKRVATVGRDVFYFAGFAPLLMVAFPNPYTVAGVLVDAIVDTYESKVNKDLNAVASSIESLFSSKPQDPKKSNVQDPQAPNSKESNIQDPQAPNPKSPKFVVHLSKNGPYLRRGDFQHGNRLSNRSKQVEIVPERNRMSESEIVYRIMSVVTLGLLPLAHKIYNLVIRSIFDLSGFFEDLNLDSLESSNSDNQELQEIAEAGQVDPDELDPPNPRAHLNMPNYPGNVQEDEAELSAERLIEDLANFEQLKPDYYPVYFASDANEDLSNFEPAVPGWFMAEEVVADEAVAEEADGVVAEEAAAEEVVAEPPAVRAPVYELDISDLNEYLANPKPALDAAQSWTTEEYQSIFGNVEGREVPAYAVDPSLDE